MTIKPYSFVGKFLVIWYEIYQTGHLTLNSLYLAGAISFPPLLPEKWTEQAVTFFNGMASADLINVILSLVFVYGYFRRARWSM
jgi:hypothetical protein